MEWVVFSWQVVTQVIMTHVARQKLQDYCTVLVNLSTKYVHMCHTYRLHWLLLFYTTFTDPDLGWGSLHQCKVKLLDFIFSHTFQLIRLKFDLVLKQFKLHILILLLIQIWWNEGNDCCFTDLKKMLRLACIWTFLTQFGSDLAWRTTQLYSTMWY